jgi:cytoskeletal protein CcmA (bactofilin family)
MNDPRFRRFRDRASSAATLITEGCKISGDLSGACDFQISGEIAGDCDIDGTVTLSENGSWQGSIRADNVIIAGRVEGDVIARNKVEITSTANIVGTVTGEAVAVAEGAIVEGVMKTTGQTDPLEFREKRSSE